MLSWFFYRQTGGFLPSFEIVKCKIESIKRPEKIKDGEANVKS